MLKVGVIPWNVGDFSGFVDDLLGVIVAPELPHPLHAVGVEL